MFTLFLLECFMFTFYVLANKRYYSFTVPCVIKLSRSVKSYVVNFPSKRTYVDELNGAQKEIE